MQANLMASFVQVDSLRFVRRRLNAHCCRKARRRWSGWGMGTFTQPWYPLQTLIPLPSVDSQQKMFSMA